MTRWTWAVAVSVLLTVASGLDASAQAPPAPVLVAPANGTALVQPIGLEWNEVVDPDGPIGSYTWQVSSTSTFGVVIASGFTNDSGDPSIPTRTDAKVSGLPNGTYFWRVMAKQIVGGATFSVDSPWSAVRSFTVVGLGPAPGRPSFTSPASPARFHVREFFLINWTPVPGAHHYVLEADDESSFSYPLTLTTEPLQFGTSFRAGWGNALSIFYRVVAVSADGVRGLPSPTLSVQITNAAPVPPAPSLLSPIGGASVTLPFRLDWTDTADPQVAGYEVDIDDEPNFLGTVGVLFVQGVTPLRLHGGAGPAGRGQEHLPPGHVFLAHTCRARRRLRSVVGGTELHRAPVARDTARAVDLPHHQRARQRLGWQPDAGSGDAQHARTGGRSAHQPRQRHAVCRRAAHASSFPRARPT